MQHHFFTPAPDMNAMRNGIPRALAAVVRRAMKKKPENRYATTREMVDAIDAIPQTPDERRQGEEMLRALAHGSKLPHVATSAAPTLTTSVAASDARLSSVLRAARGRGWSVAAILGVVLIVLLASGALAARAYFGPNGATRRAVRLYDAGQVDAARMAFTRLASDYPRRPIPRIYLGRIARETRQYADAKRELEAAIQLEPGNPVAMREMGSLMYVTGRFDLAERFYRRALDRAPDDALARGISAARCCASVVSRKGSGCASRLAPARGTNAAEPERPPASPTLEHHEQRPVVGGVSLDDLGADAALTSAEIQVVDPLPRHGVGIAEAVARAATYGPGVLPPGIADAVLRLAFGRGVEIPAEQDAVAGTAPQPGERENLRDLLQARAVRSRGVEMVLITWIRPDGAAISTCSADRGSCEPPARSCGGKTGSRTTVSATIGQRESTAIP